MYDIKSSWRLNRPSVIQLVIEHYVFSVYFIAVINNCYSTVFSNEIVTDAFETQRIRIQLEDNYLEEIVEFSSS